MKNATVFRPRNPFSNPCKVSSCMWRLSDKFVVLCCSPFSIAAHRVLRHGHLPGFLRGRVAGLPHSTYQDQTQAEEKPGQCRENTFLTTRTGVWMTQQLVYGNLYICSLGLLLIDSSHALTNGSQRRLTSGAWVKVRHLINTDERVAARKCHNRAENL